VLLLVLGGKTISGVCVRGGGFSVFLTVLMDGELQLNLPCFP